MLFGYLIFQGWAFLSKFKAAKRNYLNGTLNCSWLIQGALFLDLPHERMRSTQSVNKHETGHPLERHAPAVDRGAYPVEGRLLPGTFHRNQKLLRTGCHIHTRGRNGFPLGVASLHVSSSSLAPLGPSSSPSAFGSAASLEVSCCSLAWAI